MTTVLVNQMPSPDAESAFLVAGLSSSTIGELSESIRTREVSPVDVVRACLARIDKLNPRLNAFITVLADDALREAETAAAQIRAGQWRGPLHGVPVGIKDLFDTAGIRTTAAFEHFTNRIPSKDAEAVSRLKEAGAIVIGKTNLHTLAMGSTSAVSDYGCVHNPWNPDYIAGGSSGGSAVAVASGMCFATLDTDAIGSCRLPAACCGVTGFKGTYALISGRGILEGERVDAAILCLAHSAVTTRSAADAMLLVNVLAEYDPRSKQEPDYRAAPSPGDELRIAVVSNFSANADVRAAFHAALETLGQWGRLGEVTAPLECPGLDVRHIQADRQAVSESLFQDIDVLVLPTTTTTTPTIESVTGNPMALSAQNTLFANYYGLPAISVPCGLDRNGLPLGLQIVGKPHDDMTVLRLAQLYQEATEWSRRRPLSRLYALSSGT